MKTKTSLLIVVLLLLTSCNSQNNMDLLNLELPVEDNVLINENFQTKEYDVYPDYNIYKSFDPKLLYVNNKSIDGELFEGDDLHRNHLLFYRNNENKKIPLLNLRSMVTKKNATFA